MRHDKYKIFIVDDHPIVRHGLRQIICVENDLEVCGEAGNVNEAISKISKSQPDLVIVDISLNGDMGGFDLIKAIDERYNNTKTLVISMYEESFYIDRAMRAGAKGYIAKKYAYNTIIDAIRKVLEGGLYLSDNASDILIQNMYQASSKESKSPIDSLSKRELEIFQMIGNGLDTKYIAEKLGLSINTIQTNKRHIKEKLGIKSHNDLIRRAALYIQSKI